MDGMSIWSNLLRPPKSVAEYDQEAQASQLNALQLQQGRMKADEYTRGIADQNALRDAYKRFGSDETANANALYGVGQGKAAQDYLAKIADIKKTTSAASKDDIQAKGYALDQSIKAHDFQVQKLAAVNNPQDAAMWAQDALKNGIFTPEQYQRGVQALQQAAQSPQTFEQWKQQALQGGQTATETLKQQQQLLIANNQNATSRANNADTNATHIKTTGMSNAVTMRGQNMVDARSKQALDSPQYMETDAGLVALPKKLAPGQAPTGTPVLMADGTPLSKPLKDIPATVNSAIISNGQSLGKIKQALDLVGGKNVGDPTKGGATGDAEATGLKGYLPNGLLNRVDPKGVETRALISDIGSLKIHDRSGAAVTVSESPRLMPFIPLATDDAVTVTKKLNSLRRELESESQALGDTYSKGNGYKGKPAAPAARTVTRTGTDANGKKVVQYSDGSIEHAN